MDDATLQRSLDDVFDQAIVYHAFTDYMRDYEVITHSVADPRTEIRPTYDRYLFRYCVEARVTTAVTPDTWNVSLDDGLLNWPEEDDVTGYVWGVRWQCLHPGGSIVADSAAAQRWGELIDLPFREVRLETNGHDISLVVHDLEVSVVAPSWSPFVIQTAADE
jgi:hypothetical protein